jgi:hypothetical protein
MIRRVAVAVGLIVLFTVANRAAFEGYFSDDDLDNLSWATVAGTPGLLKDFVSLRFSENNTRATGALFYKYLGLAYGLDFPRYVIWLFAIHWLNCGLLGWLAIRRGAPELGAWCAAVFWGFHAGLLEAWWKPMYCFDLLCGTFCLVTWLLFGARKTWLAVLTFLIAYRAKEVAVFLPVAMAFEDWRRVWPFALVSASFSVQAMGVNAGRNNDYTLRFTWQSLTTTVPFYAKHFFNYKWGALLMAPLGWFWRERQLWFGVAGMLAMMLPLLFLPRRLFSVYWYVPMIPLALGIAHVVAKAPRAALALGMLCWAGLNFAKLREKRKTELAIAQENQAYVQQLTTFYALRPFPVQVFLEGAPPGLRPHGVLGALTLASGKRGAQFLNSENEGDRQRAASEDLMTLVWHRASQALSIAPHRYREAKLSAIDLTAPQSAWALRGGWTGWQNEYRVAAGAAKLGLYAPPDTRRIAIRWHVLEPARVRVLAGANLLGESSYASPGQMDWEAPIATRGEVELTIEATPRIGVSHVEVKP